MYAAILKIQLWWRHLFPSELDRLARNAKNVYELEELMKRHEQKKAPFGGW
jgi:hypothetical protein